MKAKELMIGDWATCKKWIELLFKITRINDSGKYYYGITEEGSRVGPFLLKELEPIPLTPEILEKNEWYIPDDGLWWRHSVAPFLMSERTYGYYLYADAEHDKREFFCIINYVHQLQHALRLCGIEKEIVL